MEVYRAKHFSQHFKHALMKMDFIFFKDREDRNVDLGHRSPTAQHFILNSYVMRFSIVNLLLHCPEKVAKWPEGLVPVRLCNDERCLAAGHVVFEAQRIGAAAKVCKRADNCAHEPRCILHGSGKFVF